MDLLLTNALVATCDVEGSLAGDWQAQLGVIPNGAIGIEHGRVVYVGPSADVDATRAKAVVDVQGGAVLPGLVDPHTHLVFAGSRVAEFARRMAGESYVQIAKEGGGIVSTVRATREASATDLHALVQTRARTMRRLGVTAAEVKSGYHLSLEGELLALRTAGATDVIRTAPTFLGAHAVPPEYRDNRGAYLDLVVDMMLPAVKAQGIATSCDVYIDEGAFTRAEGERILRAAKALGLSVRAHVGQFKDLGGPELLSELGGLSADHLEAFSDEGAAAMAQTGVVAVLLPGAFRTLRQEAPDTDRLRKAGVAMAVGTDLNPGTSPCPDLGLCASLAVRDAGLTLEEAILGVTSVAAKAAGLPEHGRIRVGAQADLLVQAEPDPRTLAYCLGGYLPRAVVMSGQVVEGELATTQGLPLEPSPAEGKDPSRENPVHRPAIW